MMVSLIDGDGTGGSVGDNGVVIDGDGSGGSVGDNGVVVDGEWSLVGV